MTTSRIQHFVIGLLIACSLMLSLSLVLSVEAAGWRYDGTGRFPNAKPAINWSKDKNVRWKIEMPGRSLASPVVVGQRVFVTSDPSELMCLSIEDGVAIWQRSHEYADVFDAAKSQTIEANCL
jgi:hypothetical protein